MGNCECDRNSKGDEDRAKFRENFSGSDEKTLAALSGLIDEAYDCRREILETKALIRRMKEARKNPCVWTPVAKLLVAQRASYTNMMSKLCRFLVVDKSEDMDDGLEDYL